MIYKETLPFIDIFKFTFLDRTELTVKLVPFFRLLPVQSQAAG